MDESFTMMIAKEKGFWPDIDTKDYSKNFEEYDYLMEKHLIVPGKHDFSCHVRDLYCLFQEEYLDKYGAVAIPTPEAVADLIDEQNQNIISMFCSARDESNMDNLSVLYAAVVTINLQSEVESALTSLGLPFSRREIVRIQNSGSGFCCPDQLMIYKWEDLYE